MYNIRLTQKQLFELVSMLGFWAGCIQVLVDTGKLEPHRAGKMLENITVMQNLISGSIDSRDGKK